MDTSRLLLLRRPAAVPATAADPPRAAGRMSARSRAAAALRARPELPALLAAAALLNLWGLARNGWANEYYSAAVRSMATSWHAFLYGSFDVGGLMTVDKPPLALWIQALSARAFGIHPLSVLVPQALMGVAAVGLVYDLTRRRFGRAAGAVAGLVLATTPTVVAVSRHNNPDALLMLCAVAALWCVVRALDDGRTRWLVLAGVCVGLGFETKMAVALMVVPGIAAAWLWVAPRGRRAAAAQVLAAGAAMVAVGGAWPLLVALTPTSDRPWISGTSDNSIVSLILGYNGVGRLSGQTGGPQGTGAGPGGGGFFGGSAGPLRLLNDSLGGQGGWLLGFAVAGGLAIVVASRLRRSDARTGWLLAVGGAFLVSAVAFSAAQGIFHPYYVSFLAPFAAALVGAGAAEIARAGNVARVAAPLAVAAGVVVELVVLHRSAPGEMPWLTPLLVLGGVGAVAALAYVAAPRLRAAVVAAVVGLLLLAPATWAVQTLGHATNGTFPTGGPASASFDRRGPGRAMRVGAGGPGRAMRVGAGGPGNGAPPTGGFPTGAPPARAAGGAPSTGAAGSGAFRGGPAGGGMFGDDSRSLAAALRYVRRHGGGTIAVSSQSGAAGRIIASGADVAGIGGFSGRESQVSVAWLAQAIRDGRIRWVLADATGAGMRNDGRVGSRDVMALLAEVGRRVTVSGVTIYDVAGKADALLTHNGGA